MKSIPLNYRQSLVWSLVAMCFLLGMGWTELKSAEPGGPGKFSFIDLDDKTNQKLSEDFHGYQGNNLEPLPRGEQEFASIPFFVGEGMIQLAGKRAPDFPSEVSGIKVGDHCTYLHFLHGTGWGSPGVSDGTKIGYYRVRYADGTDEEVPIVYGEDVRDWWQLADNRGVSRAEIGWTGINEASANFRGRQVQLRLFVRSWENPKPDVPIGSLHFVSLNNTSSSPFLIAITCEQAVDEDQAIQLLREEQVFVGVADGHAVSATLSTRRAKPVAVQLLSHLPHLKKLDLSNNVLDAEVWPQLPSLSSVESLSLNLTNADDDAVAQVVRIDSLRRLYLHGTNITDEAAMHLAESRLEVLDMSETQISDRAIADLKRIESLKEIDLRGTRVTNEAAAELTEALPSTNIKVD